MSELYHYTIKLKRVIDGDTIVADIDLGFGVWLPDRRCRIAHIQAPEITQPGGVEAKEYLEGLIKDVPLTVEVVQRVDKYGRPLIKLFAWERDVGALMLSNGHAIPYGLVKL